MVETFIPNPVVGDMRINHEYDEWKDFGGVKMWTEEHSHFVEAYQADNRQFRVNAARANVKVAPETFAVPADVAQAARPAVRVESRQLAPGVWFLGGGSHNSVLVEFRDFVTVVEAPQNDERSQAVVAEVRRLVPNKPIRYVVNTHYHWDHSGGLRGLVAAGAQIVTHDRNAEYYQRVMFGRERKLMPDSLSQREELLGLLTNPQFVRIGNQGFIHDRRPLSTEVSKVMEFVNIGTGSPPYSNHNEFCRCRRRRRKGSPRWATSSRSSTSRSPSTCRSTGNRAATSSSSRSSATPSCPTRTVRSWRRPRPRAAGNTRVGEWGMLPCPTRRSTIRAGGHADDIRRLRPHVRGTRARSCASPRYGARQARFRGGARPHRGSEEDRRRGVGGRGHLLL
ncbi:MAG: MBL fold metallo-hydrolase [Acidobacteria bacterium]|nr:MBL fold metallo-hydrolase [Acidobacteriota bacterium]